MRDACGVKARQIEQHVLWLGCLVQARTLVGVALHQTQGSSKTSAPSRTAAWCHLSFRAHVRGRFVDSAAEERGVIFRVRLLGRRWLPLMWGALVPFRAAPSVEPNFCRRVVVVVHVTA